MQKNDSGPIAANHIVNSHTADGSRAPVESRGNSLCCSGTVHGASTGER